MKVPDKEKKKILVVDDDVSFVESVGEVLKASNFEIAKASGAEQAFEALSLEKPDLILLDVNLPDKNGFDVLRVIRASMDFSRTPVILITGDMTVQIDKVFSEGADDCIIKPVNLDKLVKDINRLLK
ncbi:MAG: response regulator [Endomicrobia bacterium]|nr:response regulator [Endomicrobiia bacterium]